MPLTIAPGTTETNETPSFADAIDDLLSKAQQDADTAATAAAGERAAKMLEYVRLIREQDSDLAPDILKLAGELNISHGDVKRDADAIRRALELEPVAKAAEGRLKRLNEVNEEFKSLHDRHADERAAMKRIQAEADCSYYTATNAEQELRRLKASRPELFPDE